MIDLIGELKRIMNKDANETFTPLTDSLEAISEALGIGPGVGLWMFGICAAGMAPSTNTIVTDNLGTELPDDVFNNEFWMQVIHNASAPGAAPEREWRRITNFVGATQTFTVDAFSANVEPGDLLAIAHESVLPIEILGFGTLTVSSTTVPADNGRAALYAWENDNYFNGCLLMPTEGDCRFQPRRIVDFTRVGGIFTLDPNNPFSQLPGTVDYIIIGDQTEFTPAADGVNNRIPADVLGNKASTAIYAKDNVSDIIRYLKGLMDSTITAWGVADAGSGAGLVRDATRTEADDWWNGQTILMLTGAATGQKRPISDFLAASDDIIPAPVFDAAVGAGDIYIILAHYNQIVPRTADNVSNALTSEVVGRKDDSAVYAPDNVSSLVRYLKGLMGALGAFTAAENLKAILGAYTAAAPLKAAIDAILEDTGTTLDTKLNTIAGYLDTEIAAILAAVDTEVAAILADTNELQTDWVDGGRLDLLLDAVKAQTDKIAGKMLFSMDFWSVTLESVVLTDIAAPGTDVALPDVVVDLPAGATVVRAVAMFKFRMLGNAGAANALQGDQHIGVQKGGAGGYVDAISLDDNMFGIAAATREGGDVVIGDHNIFAKVTADDTYNVQWTASLVDVANLTFNDVQTGLRIWYSV